MAFMDIDQLREIVRNAPQGTTTGVIHALLLLHAKELMEMSQEEKNAAVRAFTETENSNKYVAEANQMVGALRVLEKWVSNPSECPLNPLPTENIYEWLTLFHKLLGNSIA